MTTPVTRPVLAVLRVVAWCDLVLGALVLSHGATAGFTGNVLLGGLVLVAVGALLLRRVKSWQRPTELRA